MHVRPSNLYGRMVDAICDKSHEVATRKATANKDPIVIKREDVVEALRIVAQLYAIYVPK